MKTTLKPFNIKTLKNRDKVVIVSGDTICYEDVRIVCTDRLATDPIIALAKVKKDIEFTFGFDKSGKSDIINKELKIKEIEFEKGDFIFDEFNESISIFSNLIDITNPHEGYKSIATLFKVSPGVDGIYINITYNALAYLHGKRLATESEKQILLEVLYKNGMIYNSEKKCLEHNFIKEEFKQGQAVLVRDTDNDSWMGTIFIALSPLSLKDKGRYVTAIGIYNQCIDYNTNSNKLLTKTKIYNGNSL